MTDPRIERTRSHVLTVTRRILAQRTGEPLSFSRLAQEAQVSRRTLYTHWGTIERVIGEAVAMHSPVGSLNAAGLEPREILRRLLVSTRERLADPVTHVAVTSLVSQAATDSKAAEALSRMSTERLEEYNALLGHVDHNQYSRIVGPLFFNSIVLGEQVSDEFIETQIDCAMDILGLS